MYALDWKMVASCWYLLAKIFNWDQWNGFVVLPPSVTVTQKGCLQHPEFEPTLVLRCLAAQRRLSASYSCYKVIASLRNCWCLLRKPASTWQFTQRDKLLPSSTASVLGFGTHVLGKKKNDFKIKCKNELRGDERFVKCQK